MFVLGMGLGDPRRAREIVAVEGRDEARHHALGQRFVEKGAQTLVPGNLGLEMKLRLERPRVSEIDGGGCMEDVCVASRNVLGFIGEDVTVDAEGLLPARFVLGVALGPSGFPVRSRGL